MSTNMQLTTQQAADHLGIPHSALVKFLEYGDIPFSTVDGHRRVALTDLVAYEEDPTWRRRAYSREATRNAVGDGSYLPGAWGYGDEVTAPSQPGSASHSWACGPASP